MPPPKGAFKFDITMKTFWSPFLHSITLVLIINSQGLDSASITTSSAHKTDKLALLAFKEKITKDPLGVLNSWNESLHFCEWRGVTCSKLHRDRVTVLDLESQALQGTLSPHIGNLTFLQKIILTTNNFSGAIPPSLSQASTLDTIKLDSNQFTGSVPRDLGRLQSLRTVSIGLNPLGTNLGDDLSFINSLTNCTKLEHLCIGYSNLIGRLPNSITNLSTQIHYLSVAGNQIYGRIPIGIENLVKLQILDVSGNYLTGTIPNVLGKINGLKSFFTNRNKISGQIPTSLGNLTQLRTLDLSRNELHGSIPPNLGNCQNLLRLDLSYNKLNSTIPKNVMSFPSHMYALVLSHNALSGPLPSEVKNLSSLHILDVSQNRLSGHIPGELGSCLSLEYLDIKGNFFEGKIPQSLTFLTAMKHLDLSSNKLSGNIPNYLGSFNLLTYMNMSYNELEGPVPTEGVFARASIISVAGNDKLCGGVVELKLHACPIKKKEKGKLFVLKIMVIPVIIVSLCFVLLLCFSSLKLYQRRMQQKKPSTPSLLNHQHPRISYAELLDSTNGFSADTLIGAGRYGTVYKGFLKQSETIVAVKVLNLQERGASKSFLAECNALRNLRHRNLVKIVTCCSSMDFLGNDFKALVYEFIPNGSLEEWLHPIRAQWRELRSLNFQQRLNVAIDVAAALDYLHHRCQPAVVHSDVKPSNILLNDELTAHLSDFGLARVSSTASSYTSSQGHSSSSLMKGSIGYIAPEYGMGCDASIKGDVYSYGILLLEMFTGKRPTDGMFQDGRNLHNYATTALLEQVINIVDPTMLQADNGCGSMKFVNHSDGLVRMNECLVSVITLGVKCSVESPMKRLNMGDVVTELYHIRESIIKC